MTGEIKLDHSNLGSSWRSLAATNKSSREVPAAKQIPDRKTMEEGLSAIDSISKKLGRDLRAVIFSTARDRDTIDYRFIHDIAFVLVDVFGFKVGSGGGPGGMVRSNEGAVAARRDLKDSFSVAIDLPHEKPHTFVDPEQSQKMPSFLPRKMGLIHISDLTIAVPGGYGTLEEIFEVLGLMVRGKAPWRHMILVESGMPDGRGGFKAGSFYEPVRTMLHKATALGVFPPDVLEHLEQYMHFVDAPDPDTRLQDFMALIEDLEPEIWNAHRSTDHITHPANKDDYQELIGQDLDVVHGLFDHLDPSMTISVIGGSHMTDQSTARDVGKLVAKMMRHGANVLYSGERQTTRRVMIEARRVEKNYREKIVVSHDRIPGTLLHVKGDYRDESVDDTSSLAETQFLGRVEFKTNPIRKAALTNYSHAYFFTLGGIDTFDLLFEIMTLMQTQKIRTSPIIVLDPNNEWETFDAVCQRLAAYRTINPEDLQFVKRVKNINEAEVVLKDVLRRGTVQPEPHILKPSIFDRDLYKTILTELGVDAEHLDQLAQELVDQNIKSHDLLIKGLESLWSIADPRIRTFAGDLNQHEDRDGVFSRNRIKAGLIAHLQNTQRGHLVKKFLTPAVGGEQQPKWLGRYWQERALKHQSIVNAGRITYENMKRGKPQRIVNRGVKLH